MNSLTLAILALVFVSANTLYCEPYNCYELLEVSQYISIIFY